jgi:prepilin-type N-terminal cleavage/methylation domain-containing protein
MYQKYQLGFTYIELIIVMALIGIIGSYSLAINLSGSRQSTVINERNQLVTLVLYKIRSEAIANINESDHGVHIDNQNKQYLVFSGNNYDFTNLTNIAIPFGNNKLDVTTNPETDIIFKAISGDAVSSTTISIRNDKTEALIDVNNLGQINW